MQKQKKYYTVEIECLLPAIVKYRVLVDEGNYEQAIVDSIKLHPIEKPILRFNKMKRLKAKVYDWGTSMLKHVKDYF
jgi:hypothetical protein